MHVNFHLDLLQSGFEFSGVGNIYLNIVMIVLCPLSINIAIISQGI